MKNWTLSTTAVEASAGVALLGSPVAKDACDTVTLDVCFMVPPVHSVLGWLSGSRTKAAEDLVRTTA